MIRFDEMGLREEILAAITDLGFVEPTPIQQKTIPHLLTREEDLIAIAQTGTGKTAGFGLPVLQNINTGDRDVQALVLCPTRELCLQITRDLESFGKHLKGFHVTAVYGGASMEVQIRSLKKSPQVVVGTPGRTLDLIKRKVLKLSNLKWLVLDEADEMLSMGFKDDLDAILATAPPQRQSLLFSATMPKDIRMLAGKYMEGAVELNVSKEHISTENVSHGYYLVGGRDRYLALKRIADMHPKIYAIIFCRTRSETKDIASKLSQEGYNADALHGDLSQAQRDHVMDRFRQRQLQLLVATDVAARGLDVTDLTHVINYNLPDDDAVYIHRSGRTGRGGKRGWALSIIHVREKGRIKHLTKLIGKPMQQLQVPSAREICEKQLYNVLDKMEKVEVNEEQIADFLPAIASKWEWMSREELIKRFVWVEFSRFLSYYKDVPDKLHEVGNEREVSREDRKKKQGRFDFSWFYLNLGSKNKLNPARLFALLNQHMPTKNVEIGRISIKKSHVFFELDKTHKDEAEAAFRKVRFQGVPLRLEELAADFVPPDLHESSGKRSSKGGGKKAGKRKDMKKKVHRKGQ
ncbi:MAG: DEAD/DEAH box helicase [Flavobacteriales bacterium]|nr:DEAD/DEAH box helicase [Flavobacteriales bacterium]MCB9446811.1 DEAD/DEAH box helicase [Flavobacteriales bacterium]